MYHSVCTPQVQYYGLIKQSTGEDWEDAKISLSTAQPAIGGGAPNLPTKVIRFKRPIPQIVMRRFGAAVQGVYRQMDLYIYFLEGGGAAEIRLVW